MTSAILGEHHPCPDQRDGFQRNPAGKLDSGLEIGSACVSLGRGCGGVEDGGGGEGDGDGTEGEARRWGSRGGGGPDLVGVGVGVG
jgi:hypothetical protein